MHEAAQKNIAYRAYSIFSNSHLELSDKRDAPLMKGIKTNKVRQTGGRGLLSERVRLVPCPRALPPSR